MLFVFSLRDFSLQDQATLKKSLFPVQWVAEIMATRATAISSFFSFFLFLFGKRSTKIFGNFFSKIEKKVSSQPYLDSPGRWTGNNIFF